MAAPANKDKIIVGAGRLKRWDASLATPAFVELGGTEDGVEITRNPEFFDVEAAEAPVTLKKELTKMTATLTVGLLEATLDNLLLAWGGDVNAGTLTVAADGTVTEEKLELTGKGVDGLTRTYTFNRVVSMGSGGHRYTNGSKAVIECEFEILPEWDDVNSQWVFFTVVDA